MMTHTTSGYVFQILEKVTPIYLMKKWAKIQDVDGQKKSEKKRKKGLTKGKMFGIIAEHSQKRRICGGERGSRKEALKKVSKKVKKVLDKAERLC